MPIFVVTATHSSDQCPLSNSKVRQMFPTAQARTEASGKNGVKFLAGPVYSINHKTIAVVEASNLDSVMNVLMELRIPQWNSVDVQPYMTTEDVFKAFETVKTIY